MRIKFSFLIISDSLWTRSNLKMTNLNVHIKYEPCVHAFLTLFLLTIYTFRIWLGLNMPPYMPHVENDLHVPCPWYDAYSCSRTNLIKAYAIVYTSF